MMKIAVNRLSESARPTLAEHFLALPMRDRNLRFGMALAPSAIAAYVDQIDLERDAVLGVHDERNVLVGVAHVAVQDNQAELALSVLPVHRRRGIASAMLKRAIGLARSRRVAKLFMHFLTANIAIMRLAQKFRMDIVESGSDADAYLNLQSVASAPFETMLTNAFDYSTSCIRIRCAARAAAILLAVFSALSLVDAAAVRALSEAEAFGAVEDSAVAPAWAVAMSTPLISGHQRQRQ
jgi:GNAT superfamily N-acetyltransferase